VPVRQLRIVETTPLKSQYTGHFGAYLGEAVLNTRELTNGCANLGRMSFITNRPYGLRSAKQFPYPRCSESYILPLRLVTLRCDLFCW